MAQPLSSAAFLQLLLFLCILPTKRAYPHHIPWPVSLVYSRLKKKKAPIGPAKLGMTTQGRAGYNPTAIQHSTGSDTGVEGQNGECRVGNCSGARFPVHAAAAAAQQSCLIFLLAVQQTPSSLRWVARQVSMLLLHAALAGWCTHTCLSLPRRCRQLNGGCCGAASWLATPQRPGEQPPLQQPCCHACACQGTWRAGRLTPPPCCCRLPLPWRHCCHAWHWRCGQRAWQGRRPGWPADQMLQYSPCGLQEGGPGEGGQEY